MKELAELRRNAREIFEAALCGVDAREAVRRAVHLEGSGLTIVETNFDLPNDTSGVYAVAIGKAALPMAVGLDDALGGRIERGFIAGSLSHQELFKHLFFPPRKFVTPWRVCEGGHPLPTRGSLIAAESVSKLLKRADADEALVVFLVSGGGSAMIEFPRDDSITLFELRKANRLLVSCGASIAEINAVRRVFSAIKGGKLAALAPHCPQVTLIISDTNFGDEANVASGPTIDPPAEAPNAKDVIARYEALRSLPESILKVIDGTDHPTESSVRFSKHYVLLDNETALNAASEQAQRLGFHTEIAGDVVEQPIEQGCALLLSRLRALKDRAPDNQPVCLISGGEFRCLVRSKGRGGRNSETVLRLATALETRATRGNIVALSAGTDGIDGNSAAAGAIADEKTLARARCLGLDARTALEASDSFSFFAGLGDAVVTGATGTNVRDVRVLLAS